MAKRGYWLCEYLSISSVLKKAFGRYGRSFLHTESDDNDVTYFVVSQLEFLQQSIDNLLEYIERKRNEMHRTRQMLQRKVASERWINPRQVALMSNAIKHPGKVYTIESHRSSHGVTYRAARRDLEILVEKKILRKEKEGVLSLYIAPDDLEGILK